MSTIGYINVSLETFGGLLICNTVLLFCDASAWLFKGRISGFSFFMVRISNFLVFSLGYLMLALFTHYLVSFLRVKDNRVTNTPIRVINGLMLFAFCLVVLSQFNHMYYFIDENNIYHRQSWFRLSQAFGIAGMVLNSWLLFCHRDKMNCKEIWAFATYIFLPVTAMLIQILMLSRSCKSGDGYRTLLLFLRRNLDSLSDTRLIPFEKEISHVNDYFYLEKMRFQDRVNLVFNLEFWDFMLPPLTIQPLVENAVRYGITKKKAAVPSQSQAADRKTTYCSLSGTMGVDGIAPNADGRSHIGIENVKVRLMLQCSALMEINSEKGIGTEVRIILPGKEKSNEKQ